MSSMNITRNEAYKILELPLGVDQDSIRTSYKRLAQKWFPEKHQNDLEALSTFKKITLAYKCLCTSSESCSITLEETFDIYRATFHPSSRPLMKFRKNHCSDSESDYITSSSDDDDEDEIREKLFSMFAPGKAKNRKENYNDSDDGEICNNLTIEQREQVANELISEEEKKKKKLEKRRAKKKQRREKKRLEKNASEDVKSNQTQKEKRSGSNGTNGSTEQSKKRSEEENNNSRLKEQAQSVEEQSQSNGLSNDSDFVLSRKYAVEGNTLASRGFYYEAIDCFTKAIQLNSIEYRYFGNRSYCYEKVDEYDKALKDADEAIYLAADWPKGHYRRGIALGSMKQYTKAEESFKEVLRLDNKCEDAVKELYKLRVIQLMDMGFSNSQAEQAASKSETLQQALDLLLVGLEKFSFGDVESNGNERKDFSVQKQSTLAASNSLNNGRVLNNGVSNGLNNGQNKNDINTSETLSGPQGDNGFVVKSTSGKNKQKKSAPLLPIPQHHVEEAQKNVQLNQQRTAEDLKMNPRNPEGLKSIWVGNVLPDVPQDEFQNMFAQFGKLQGIRFMPEKFCAFVNFIDKDAAGNAMHYLQGKECHGQRLLIKFPDHPVDTNGKPEKIEAVPATVAKPPQRIVKEARVSKVDKTNEGKVTGPVNGNECYFWRTTGCQFSDNCRFLHIPEHRGVDKKPWHKPK